MSPGIAGHNALNIFRVSRGFLPRHDGLSIHAYHLSRHQAAEGHSVYVVQPFHPDSDEGRLQIRRAAMGPLVHVWGNKVSLVLLCLHSLAHLEKQRRRNAIEILHLHGDVLECIAILPSARRYGIPVVLTLHGGLSRKPRYRMIAGRVFRRVGGIISTSEAARDDLLGLGIPGDQVEVISSGIETSIFRPPAPQERQAARSLLGIRADETLAISVGRLHPVKGYSVLVEAAARLRFLQSFRILVLGDGPEKTRLTRQAKRVANVELLGDVAHDKVVDYLHAADMFVLPSVDFGASREGTPTAVLEAMACGLPVVCTNSGGTRVLIDETSGGLVVPQRDSDALAQSLRRLASDPDLRQLLGGRNVAAAKERAWERVAERVTAFYVRTLDAGHDPAQITA